MNDNTMTGDDANANSEADLAAVFGYEADTSLAAVNKKNLSVQFGYHGMALLAAFALWGAADSWALVSNLAVANVFSVIASVVFGVAMAHVIHEWSHFAGAKWSGSQYTVKEKPSFLFFDFDYEKNSSKQFLSMSIGGTLGNLLFLALVLLLIPIDSVGRAMLLAVAIAMTVYVGSIEWPVIKIASSGKTPMESLVEYFGQGSGVLNRALMYGVLTAIVSWLIII